MDLLFLFFLSSGLFLGWSLGANDAANIFGTAVGSKMLRFKTAAVVSCLFIIIGAVFAGGGTSATLNELGSVNALAGAFMVALSAALTVYWMVSSGLLVSTSQAIVGGIIGWNLYSGYETDIGILSTIVSSWILCPLLSGGIAVIVYLIIKNILHFSHIHLLRQDSYLRCGLLIIAAFGGYALGANNIANVMGVFVDSSPFQSIYIDGWYFSKTQILFLLGALAICIGIFTYSQKTIKTVGNNLMSMTPTIAWIIVFSQSLVLFLFASQSLKELLMEHGLPSLPLVPVSSSQAVIGAIIGIGLAKGGRNISWSTIGKIIIGWIATPLISAALCFISLFFLENVFQQKVYM